MLIPALFVADAVKARCSTSANPYDVIVFAQASDVTDAHSDWMRARGVDFRDDMDMSGLSEVKRFSGRLTAATLMKLMLPEHLAGEYDRLLYLDCDLTIHDDVGRIFSLDTGSAAIAAAPSGRILAEISDAARQTFRDHCKVLGMTEPYRFFNSGVLYIDVAKWNAERLGERALAFIRQNPELCSLPDEHALNALLDGRIAELTPGWNMRPPSKERRWARAPADPVIVHHAGPDKPWKRYGRRKRLFPDRTAYRLYEEFLRETPWPGWLRAQWTAKDFWASVAWEMKLISRRLRGKLAQPTSKQRKAYVEKMLRHCEESTFADVSQGIVEWDNGKFRLRRSDLTMLS